MNDSLLLMIIQSLKTYKREYGISFTTIIYGIFYDIPMSVLTKAYDFCLISLQNESYNLHSYNTISIPIENWIL
jgi:hypothetical protein